MALYSPRSVLPFSDQQEVDTPQFDPIAKVVFGFASVTFEVRAQDFARSEAEITLGIQLLKEQNKYDEIPLSLFDRLQRLLPLADRVADEIVCEETDILEEIIPRMFQVMQRVAEFACNYVRCGRLGRRSLYLYFACAHDYSENG